MKTLKFIAMLTLTAMILYSCDNEKDEVTPEGSPAIAQWSGVYTTETQWWGGYYSPLIITSEGEMYIAEYEIDFEFDEAENRLTFDWHDIKDHRAKANIVFSGNVDDGMEFSGSINPRAQDGPVGFTGQAF